MPRPLFVFASHPSYHMTVRQSLSYPYRPDDDGPYFWGRQSVWLRPTDKPFLFYSPWEGYAILMEPEMPIVGDL